MAFEDLAWLVVKRMGALEKAKLGCCGIVCKELSGAQTHCLLEIGRRGSLSLVELAQALNLDKSTISRTVDGLVALGYVDRSQDPANRRFVALSLAERGKAAYGIVTRSLSAFAQAVLAGIPAERRAQVQESIALLESSLERIE